VSDIDSCGLTLSEIQELWLGPHPTTGSCFCSREELVAAWAAGRAVVMRLWGSGGRRPMAWWQFDTELKYPGYARERSFLWRHGILEPEETLEAEAEWQRDFDAARGMGARERREHLAYHDVPAELVTAWEAERKPRWRRARQSDSPTASGSQSMNLNVPTTPSEEAAAIK
jgi:hypothetical protein